MIYTIIILLTTFIILLFSPEPKKISWPKLLIPPLFLIPLIWIPWDIITVTFWIPGIIVFIWSVISIFVQLTILIIRHFKKQYVPLYIKLQIIRPILAVTIFLIVVLAINLSLASADKYGIEAAKQIQTQCMEQGICHDKIDGWDIEESEYGIRVSKLYGKYGTKYILRYSASDDKKEFTISVRHNIDKGFYIKGGVNKELKAKICVCGHCSDVPIK